MTTFAALTVSGCAVEQLADGIRALEGRHIETASHILGMPNFKREMLGKTVYTWRTDHVTDMTTLDTRPTTGDVGGVPFVANTMDTGSMPVPVACQIDLTVDAQGVIEHYEVQGNAGCRKWASRF
jgi:hypothetical protein